MKTRSLITFTFGALIAIPILADEVDSSTTTTTTTTYESCSRLHSMQIRTSDGVECPVQDVLIDPSQGQIVSVVTDVDNRLIPLPWTCLHVGSDRSYATVDFTRDVLITAPAIERSDLASFNYDRLQRSSNFFSRANVGNGREGRDTAAGRSGDQAFGNERNGAALNENQDRNGPNGIEENRKGEHNPGMTNEDRRAQRAGHTAGMTAEERRAQREGHNAGMTNEDRDAQKTKEPGNESNADRPNAHEKGAADTNRHEIGGHASAADHATAAGKEASTRAASAESRGEHSTRPEGESARGEGGTEKTHPDAAVESAGKAGGAKPESIGQ